MKTILASKIIDDLKTLFDSETETFGLTEAQIQQWTSISKISRKEFFNALAEYLAHGFEKRELSFDFCDVVINALAAHAGVDYYDQIFWQIYLAFDRGEYLMPSEPEGTAPSEKYTRPRLAEILKALPD